MQKKPGILFLSTGNSNRSQMAEGFLRNLAGNSIDVASAGIEPGEINPLAVEVMRDAGIDISKQKSKNVAESLKEHFVYVITVCDMARERCPIFPFTPYLLHWSLEEPANAQGSTQEKKIAFARVRDDIRQKVQSFFDEFCKDHPGFAKTASA
jgi:arsenate reductase